MPEPSKSEPSKRESSKRDLSSMRLYNTVHRVFNDDLMIVLAVVLAITVILQQFFELSPGMLATFEYLNYFIIAVFIAEYSLKLYVDDSKSSFVTDPLHILDLIIIIFAFLDFSSIGYLSALPFQAQLSPILRLLRLLPRTLLALFLAGRTVERIKDQRITIPVKSQELQIAALNPNGCITKGHLNEITSAIAPSETPIWIDFQNVKENDFDDIEDIAKIPHDLLETKLLRASFPRIDAIDNILTLFLWDSQMNSNSSSSRVFSISTNNMLILFNEEKIITLSRGKSQLFDKISNSLSNKISNKPFKRNEFTDKVLYFLLHQKMVDYSEVVQRIEQRTIEFEEVPVDKTSPQFLEETFHFKKEILKISSNLWHFRKILHQLTDKKNAELFKIDNINDFDYLHAESGYLYETTQNIKESLISLIELHTNTVSYDMNKVMKVIAVITCLAVIPSTIGGLLGVNLVEGAFPIRLVEIFFVVFSLMLLSVYAFYKMDWLK